MFTFTQFIALLKSLGASAVLSVMSFSVTRFKGKEPKRYQLNTPAELKENVEMVGAERTLFTISVPQDNLKANEIALQIATRVAEASNATVTQQVYKTKKQYTVGRVISASELVSLLGE